MTANIHFCHISLRYS